MSRLIAILTMLIALASPGAAQDDVNGSAPRSPVITRVPPVNTQAPTVSTRVPPPRADPCTATLWDRQNATGAIPAFVGCSGEVALAWLRRHLPTDAPDFAAHSQFPRGIVFRQYTTENGVHLSISTGPPPRVAISGGGIVDEGTPIRFQLRRSGNSADEIPVGIAIEGSEWLENPPGDVTIAAGRDQAELILPTRDDPGENGQRVIMVRLLDDESRPYLVVPPGVARAAIRDVTPVQPPITNVTEPEPEPDGEQTNAAVAPGASANAAANEMENAASTLTDDDGNGAANGGIGNGTGGNGSGDDTTPTPHFPWIPVTVGVLVMAGAAGLGAKLWMRPRARCWIMPGAASFGSAGEPAGEWPEIGASVAIEAGEGVILPPDGNDEEDEQ